VDLKSIFPDERCVQHYDLIIVAGGFGACGRWLGRSRAFGGASKVKNLKRSDRDERVVCRQGLTDTQ
jgi:hypothetical protein